MYYFLTKTGQERSSLPIGRGHKNKKHPLVGRHFSVFHVAVRCATYAWQTRTNGGYAAGAHYGRGIGL